MVLQDHWFYKGYILEIHEDVEEDNIKYFHSYRKLPFDEFEELLETEADQAKMTTAHITPYDCTRGTFELYIDALITGADPKGSRVSNVHGHYTGRTENWNKDLLVKWIYERGNYGG